MTPEEREREFVRTAQTAKFIGREIAKLLGALAVMVAAIILLSIGAP